MVGLEGGKNWIKIEHVSNYESQPAVQLLSQHSPQDLSVVFFQQMVTCGTEQNFKIHTLKNI